MGTCGFKYSGFTEKKHVPVSRVSQWAPEATFSFESAVVSSLCVKCCENSSVDLFACKDTRSMLQCKRRKQTDPRKVSSETCAERARNKKTFAMSIHMFSRSNLKNSFKKKRKFSTSSKNIQCVYPCGVPFYVDNKLAAMQFFFFWSSEHFLSFERGPN